MFATRTTGLLMSGGLDSGVLLAHLLRKRFRVQPLYVATGCAWQSAERQAVSRFIAALQDGPFRDGAIAPVVELDLPVEDLYGEHWSMTGKGTPDASTPDEAVFLWGRNPLLLIKPMLWCAMNDISQLALGTLECNPFTDATSEFFEQFEMAMARAVQKRVEIVRPFSEQSKQQILAMGVDLPLHLTFSCLAPVDNRHCGACNKCAERAEALESALGNDRTIYAHQLHPTEQVS